MSELNQQSIQAYLSAVAARTPTPGGGTVAAIVAAEACALLSMVAGFSKDDAAAGIASRVAVSISTLSLLADDDASAFEAVMAAHKGSQNGSQQRKDEKRAASEQAASIPARVIALCQSHLDDLEHLSVHGNPNLITDIAIAALLFDAAMKSCEVNILINLKDFDQVPVALQNAMDSVPVASSRLQFIASTVRSGLT